MFFLKIKRYQIFFIHGVLLSNIWVTSISHAASANEAINQVEQDKARKKALTPDSTALNSRRFFHKDIEVIIPTETPCFTINGISIENNNQYFKTQFLQPILRQVENHCLGKEGIHNLVDALQNSLITQGFITSRIYIPNQDLRDRHLILQLQPGIIGNIRLSAPGARRITFANTLAFKHNDILNLRDLEQTSANLQRIPGSSAKIHLLPGAREGESDIVLSRTQEKDWQLTGWLNDAGSRYSGRYNAGTALYLYNPTTLNDMAYVSVGHDLLYHNGDKGNKNASLWYSIPWEYWWLELYASRSQYHQPLKGGYFQWRYQTRYRYYSAELSRTLSHTANQTTSAGVKIFRGTSRASLEGTDLQVMRKENPGWKITFQHQHRFPNAGTLTTLGFQNRLPWLEHDSTPERRAGFISRQARIITFNTQALINLSGSLAQFSYAQIGRAHV